ncbi:hypothetical protein D6D03_02531 [Aureobasidium pullulans]|nr:hypothetical protein D6D03_02531 [Aureobasidium pullulans]
MDQQPSSAYTRFPESSRFRSSKADSEDDFEDDREDDLEWLEHDLKDDLHGHYDQLTSDSRGRYDLSNNGTHESRHDRAPRSQPPWRESFYDTHTASHSRPQSRQRDPTIRINLPPLPFFPRVFRALEAILTSDWAVPLLLTALTLWIWEIPSAALFWNPAAGLASLSDNLTGPVKGVPGSLGAGLKHQMCKTSGMSTLLHCPRPEKQTKAKPKKWKPRKEKPVYPNKWTQVYFSINDQRRDMVSSGIDLEYETGREVMNHMSRLWANLDQQNVYYKLYDASMQRQCKARLSAYNKLPAQIRFGFLYGSDWEEFMYDLQYSYTDAIERFTQISASFVGVREKTDELLKAVRQRLVTGRRKHVPKRSSLSSDMKNLFRHPEERQEEDDDEVDVEDHDWVVNLEEMQSLLVELQRTHNYVLEKMVEMKLHISTNIELSKQEAARGKRPAFLEPIMASLRKEVKGSGYPRLPTLTDAPRTGD